MQHESKMAEADVFAVAERIREAVVDRKQEPARDDCVAFFRFFLDRVDANTAMGRKFKRELRDSLGRTPSDVVQLYALYLVANVEAELPEWFEGFMQAVCPWMRP